MIQHSSAVDKENVHMNKRGSSVQNGSSVSNSKLTDSSQYLAECGNITAESMYHKRQKKNKNTTDNSSISNRSNRSNSSKKSQQDPAMTNLAKQLQAALTDNHRSLVEQQNYPRDSNSSETLEDTLSNSKKHEQRRSTSKTVQEQKKKKLSSKTKDNTKSESRNDEKNKVENEGLITVSQIKNAATGRIVLSKLKEHSSSVQMFDCIQPYILLVGKHSILYAEKETSQSGYADTLWNISLRDIFDFQVEKDGHQKTSIHFLLRNTPTNYNKYMEYISYQHDRASKITRTRSSHNKHSDLQMELEAPSDSLTSSLSIVYKVPMPSHCEDILHIIHKLIKSNINDYNIELENRRLKKLNKRNNSTGSTCSNVSALSSCSNMEYMYEDKVQSTKENISVDNIPFRPVEEEANSRQHKKRGNKHTSSSNMHNKSASGGSSGSGKSKMLQQVLEDVVEEDDDDDEQAALDNMLLNMLSPCRQNQLASSTTTQPLDMTGVHNNHTQEDTQEGSGMSIVNTPMRDTSDVSPLKAVSDISQIDMISNNNNNRMASTKMSLDNRCSRRQFDQYGVEEDNSEAFIVIDSDCMSIASSITTATFNPPPPIKRPTPPMKSMGTQDIKKTPNSGKKAKKSDFKPKAEDQHSVLVTTSTEVPVVRVGSVADRYLQNINTQNNKHNTSSSVGKKSLKEGEKEKDYHTPIRLPTPNNDQQQGGGVHAAPDPNPSTLTMGLSTPTNNNNPNPSTLTMGLSTPTNNNNPNPSTLTMGRSTPTNNNNPNPSTLTMGRSTPTNNNNPNMNATSSRSSGKKKRQKNKVDAAPDTTATDNTSPSTLTLASTPKPTVTASTAITPSAGSGISVLQIARMSATVGLCYISYYVWRNVLTNNQKSHLLRSFGVENLFKTINNILFPKQYRPLRR